MPVSYDFAIEVDGSKVTFTDNTDYQNLNISTKMTLHAYDGKSFGYYLNLMHDDVVVRQSVPDGYYCLKVVGSGDEAPTGSFEFFVYGNLVVCENSHWENWIKASCGVTNDAGTEFNEYLKVRESVKAIATLLDLERYEDAYCLLQWTEEYCDKNGNCKC